MRLYDRIPFTEAPARSPLPPKVLLTGGLLMLVGAIIACALLVGAL